MISSANVSSNAQEVQSTLNNYLSSVSDLSSSWKGMSYDNLQRNADNFVNEYSRTIKSQMDSFALAVNLYEQYKTNRSDLNITINNYNKAISYNDSSSAQSFYNQYLQYKANVENLSSQIKEALSNASSPKLEATYIDKSTLPGGRGDFVNYYQYNYSQPYSQGTIATSGCGPTSLAMVLTYLLGKEITPVEMAAKGNGRYTCSKGTVWTFFGDMSKEYGVSCEQMGMSSSNIINQLNEGKTLILSMGPGHFTTGGHFIVARGISEDGKIIVSDPNSEKRSNQTWDVSILANEGKQIWALDN